MNVRTVLRIAVIFFGLSAWGNSSYDPDLGWHLFGGAWIWKHGTLPVADPINFFREFWHDYHWAGQLLLYALYYAGELDGLRVFVGVCGAALGFLLFSIAERCGLSRPSALRSFVFTLAALIIIRPYLLPRPQILSFLLIALLVRIVVQESVRARELLVVLALSVLCAWIHIYWVFFPLVWLGTLVLPSVCFGIPTRFHIFGFALLLAAGLLDPYGAITGDPLIAYRLLVEYVTMPAELKQNIGEMRLIWQATPGEVIGLCPLLIVPISAMPGILKRSNKFAFQACSLFLFGVLLLGIMLKFLPIFAIFALPAAILGSIWIEAKLESGQTPITPSIVKFSGAAGIIIAVLIAAAGSPFLFDSNRNLWAYLPRAECEAAATREMTQGAGQTVRVLTHFNEGGWCRWFAFQKDPDLDFRVTTDGRTQGFPSDLVMDSFKLFDAESGWSKTLESWHVQFAVVPKDAPVFQLMAHDAKYPAIVTSRFHGLFRVE